MTKDKGKSYVLSNFGIDVTGLADILDDPENITMLALITGTTSSVTSPYLRDRPAVDVRPVHVLQERTMTHETLHFC